ncbi:MAG: phytoene synthase [Gammaproteobacteria bacterium RBG_16_51_14]|nr:MAG: phytoene synthase [Gammaproteobacteria bacterium RBG_16_51_14]
MKKSAIPSTDLDDEAYQQHILQDVSRTFALTIPQLPEPLKRVVSNAYLLCRIADTIEDDKTMGAGVKRQLAERFIRVVAGNDSAGHFAGDLYPLLSTETTEYERDLVANTAAVIRITHSFNSRQRAALERCVAIMAEGMARYQDAETLDGLDGLADLPDMGRYCYYVAGVVGEMLTELFCDYSGEIDQHREVLMPLSVSFGQGLQMTNILKDIWEDHHRGACWLPRDIFMKYGVDIRRKKPGQMDKGFEQGLGELIGVARAHLANALRYTLFIPRHEKGLRRFCLWALGMAVLTLDKINKNRSFTHATEVKISRQCVKTTIITTSLFVTRDRMLNHLFNLTARRLPVVPIHEKLGGIHCGV